MKNKTFIIVSAICFGIVLSAFSMQSTTNDTREQGIASLKKCSELYLQLKRFSVDVEYSVFYNSSNFSKASDTEKGKIIRKGQQFYQEEAGKTTIMNADYQIQVNNNASIISIANRGENDLIPSQMNLDSLGNYIEKVIKIDQGYQFILTHGSIEKMDLMFTSEGYLQKMRNHYRYPMDLGAGEVKVVTQIRYYNFEQNPKIKSDFFSERNYVSILNSGEVKPLGSYKNYHVLNQLEIK